MIIIKADKKGQAVIELAVFGSIILFAFAILLSYIQQLNDQQRVQMEAFRLALDKAHGSPIEAILPESLGGGKGAGSSVDYTLIENRRHSDASGNLGKGTVSTTLASSSVMWAVPKVGTEAKDTSVVKVNDDELFLDSLGTQIVNDALQSLPTIDIPVIGSLSPSFGIKNIEFATDTAYGETFRRQENTNSLTTTRNSSLHDKLTTIISYGMYTGEPTGMIDDALPDFGGHSITQYAYRDTDGQYRYSQFAPGDYQIRRGRTWQTDLDR